MSLLQFETYLASNHERGCSCPEWLNPLYRKVSTLRTSFGAVWRGVHNRNLSGIGIRVTSRSSAERMPSPTYASAGLRVSQRGESGQSCIFTFSLDLPIAWLCCCSGGSI